MNMNQLAVKHMLKKEVAIDVSSMLVHAIPQLTVMTQVWKKAFEGNNNIPSSVKASNARIMSSLRAVALHRDLPTTVIAALGNVAVNIQTVSDYVIENFPDEYDDKVATIRQKVTMAFMSLTYHIYMYLPDYINNQLLVMRALEKNEPYENTKRKQEELDEGLSTLAVALDVMGIEPKNFTHIFMTKYPEVRAGANVDSLLLINKAANPLARVKDGFRGNPFFTLGSWANTQIVDYVAYMEDRLRVSKLYLMELKAEQTGTGNPAAAKEIELLEDEISDLEYKIVKATR
jgi:hypothetical protein